MQDHGNSKMGSAGGVAIRLCIGADQVEVGQGAEEETLSLDVVEVLCADTGFTFSILEVVDDFAGGYDHIVCGTPEGSGVARQPVDVVMLLATARVVFGTDELLAVHGLEFIDENEIPAIPVGRSERGIAARSGFVQAVKGGQREFVALRKLRSLIQEVLAAAGKNRECED